ncbi:energy-coupling factor ABC transporter ATP-binding protein [Methanococcoides alaskense]|uniref:ABC transporter ATP-binding protein n=1 Tax=Methanococcoides alaskense TaxID=325778 RepID=A0AA90TY21_9EURY|nr:ATP-binding cassette domain-containing protein [Methanococcoides alaskense]MDA0524540.1 ATP-binding cassette domain-containing protein [Methanococcoides alaskense]MDR6222228.1 cobalt/nickel transport system ATP-binding protein [Methanococcoides alaskense]
MASENPIIELNHLSYKYSHSDVKALDGIDLSIYPGEKIAILGANGAGKSTLFKHLNGIISPSSGAVLIKGEAISKKTIYKARQTVGIVFQNPDDQIFSPTVEEDVAFGPINMGLSEEEVEERIRTSLELVNLSGFEKRAPHHLSGGQKKLVAIAGVLAMQPEVVVLDEPTAGLDPLNAAQIMTIIEKMNRELGMTVVLSTHDVDIIPAFADRICIIDHGQIQATGSPKEIFRDHALIQKAHLRMPRIAEVFELLQKEGLDVQIQITPMDAKEEIVRVMDMHTSE